MQLYAVFAPKEYTVRYVYEGDYPDEKTNPNKITFGESADLLPVYLYGHKFLGWYDAPEGGREIVRIDRNNILTLTVLYARFEPLEFVVELDAGEGMLVSEDGQNGASAGSYAIKFGESLPLPSCTRIGYEFLGWNESPAGDGRYYSVFTGADGYKKLYAVYTAKEYLIRYKYEGVYESEKINPNYIAYGESVTLYPVYRTGYKFLGWYDAESGGNRIDTIDESNVLSLSWLYARFEPLVFRISLDAGEGTFETPGGEFSKYDVRIEYGETFDLPECTCGGYTFLGWEDENGDSVDEINVFNIRNMNLTAKWRPSHKSYEIEYGLKGGGLPVQNPEKELAGQVLALNEPVRDGYIFLGWYGDPDGKGTRYFATPADREEDFVLYAIWQEVTVSGSAENFSYIKTSTEVTITAYNGPVGENVDVVIPSVIDELPVTHIGSSEVRQYGAWEQIAGIFGMPNEAVLRSLTIPEGVLVLKENAFNGLKVLSPVSLPSSVVSLGDGCFNGFVGEVIFSDGGNLTYIGKNAFHGVTFRGTLVLPDGLKTIDRSAFYNVKTTGVIVPDSVEVIFDSAFYQPNGYIRFMFIPDSVKYLASVSGTVYTPLSEEQFKELYDAGCTLCAGVEESTVILSDGETTQTLAGYAFSLPRPQKDGYTFLGWKDENGEFVADCYIPNRPAVLTAVYEKQSSEDGRELGNAVLLQAGQTYEFILLDGENFYFRPAAEKNCEIIISMDCGFRANIYRIRGGNTEFVGSGVNTDYIAGDVYTVLAEQILPGTIVTVQIIEISRIVAMSFCEPRS